MGNKITQYALLVLLIGLMTGQSFGAYLTDVPIELIRPNGEKLNLFASGDEFYHWVHDENGFTVIRDEQSGELYYAVKDGDKLVSSGLIPGVDDPTTAGLKSNINISPWKRERIRENIIDEQKKNAKEHNSLSAKTGNVNNLVIYVRFADDSEYSTSKSYFETMHNASSGNSMKAFYNEVSYGQLYVTTHFYPTTAGATVVSYQDLYNRNYFQEYHPTQNPTGYVDGNDKTIREQAMLKRAVDAVESQIPISLNLDSDLDGRVDNVSFIVRGNPDAWGSLLWPHRYWLFKYNVYIHGKQVWDYNLNIESMATNSVFSHEFFHTLGAPDLYRYYASGNPVGPWDIMAQTNNPPQHMTQYLKWQYGEWIASVPTITTSGVYTLNPSTSSTNNCYRINSPNSTTEYFMVEYRRKAGTFESSIPNTGLIIYRINTQVSQGNRNGPPDEVYVYRLNGTDDETDGSLVNAHFSSGSGRTTFNDNTNPRCFLDDGTNGEISISQIGSAGATISFKVTIGIQPPVLDTPGDNAGGITRRPTFNWNEVEEADSYSIQVSSDQSFSTYDIYATEIEDLSYMDAIAYLDTYTTYFWRVHAVVGTESSEWSQVYEFKTLIGPPVIVYPEADDVGVSVSPTFEWNLLTGATEYSIEVADNDQFINPIINADAITSDSYTAGGLQKSKQYYWRIAAWDQFGQGDWSEAIPFITELDKPELVSPVDMTKGIFDGDNLVWIEELSAEQYDIQISTQSDFSDLTIDSVGHDTTAYAVMGLDGNTDYFWRVRATNTESTSDWSDFWRFKTKLDPPILLSPEDDSSGVPLSFTMDWADVAGADNYIFQLTEYPDFSSIKINRDDVTESEFYVSSLSSQRRYYWRVAAVDEGGQSEWSTVFSFVSNISAPNLQEPEDDAVNVVISNRFRWQPAEGAKEYQLQLSKNSNFDETVMDVDEISGLTLNYDDLEYGVEYFWRVRSKATGKVSAWSETWSFTTGSLELGLNKPMDEAHEGPINIRFSWFKTEAIKDYSLLIANDENFDDIEINHEVGNQGEFTVDNLEFGKTYYWKVIGTTDQQEFHTDPRMLLVDVQAPSMTQPENDSKNQPLSGKIFWNLADGAKTYSYQISESSSFGMILQHDEGLTANNADYDNLHKSKKYYWRIKQIRENSESDWSNPFSFSTKLATPVLSDPINNKVMSDNGDCSWEEVEMAQTYSIQISDNPLFDFTVRSAEDLDDTKYSYVKLPDTLYYWRVKAHDGDGESEWSETGTFQVITTSVEEEIAARFKLEMNPNPFNEKLEIAIDLNNEAYEIKFYDFSGNLVGTKAGIGYGRESITWHAAELSSGVYIIRFDIGGFNFTRTVILKK
jgi:M6 family metalloprotease-like protein